jgi:hypothetical protein
MHAPRILIPRIVAHMPPWPAGSADGVRTPSGDGACRSWISIPRYRGCPQRDHRCPVLQAAHRTIPAGSACPFRGRTPLQVIPQDRVSPAGVLREHYRVAMKQVDQRSASRNGRLASGPITASPDSHRQRARQPWADCKSGFFRLTTAPCVMFKGRHEAVEFQFELSPTT